MLEKNLNGVQKPSNRALNIGKNTRAPMEGIFRGVRPQAALQATRDTTRKYCQYNSNTSRVYRVWCNFNLVNIT